MTPNASCNFLIMSDDEMMLVDDDEIVPIKNKGKGKAVETTETEDNLPW